MVHPANDPSERQGDARHPVSGAPAAATATTATTATTAAGACPFAPASATAPSAERGPRYRRPWGIRHNPAIQAEIAALDAERDCERIAFLLSAYEFPFDMTRALEVALFHTYGSRSVAGLLDRTGQFERHGQKRYDDTNLLIARFMECGWRSEAGGRAVARMNAIHGHYRIPNADFLFVLWTFIDFPVQWMAEYGWRAFTPHEEQAWFHYWIGIGRAMGIADLPADKPAYDRFVADYEAREMQPDDACERVAAATVRVMANWLPAPLRFTVQQAAACLVRPAFARAARFRPPPAWLPPVVRGVLRLRARINAVVSIERYPTLMDDKPYRSYPQGMPVIEAIGPDALKAVDARRSVASSAEGGDAMREAA